MTTYKEKVNTEIRANCVKAIGRLEQEIEWEMSAHNGRLSKLQVRIKHCKETIDRIDIETIIT